MIDQDITLIESLAIEEGHILNLEWHEKRYQESYDTAFGKNADKTLLQGLELTLPSIGLHKLRIEYGLHNKDYSTQAYTRKPISTLKMVVDNHIDYPLKYADRSTLDALYELKGECQDVIIIKNGFVTDTTIGNLVFFDGKEWFTPNSPLLRGTQRAKLIANGTIKEIPITTNNMLTYKGFQVVNAMRPFSPDNIQDISGIL